MFLFVSIILSFIAIGNVQSVHERNILDFSPISNFMCFCWYSWYFRSGTGLKTSFSLMSTFSAIKYTVQSICGVIRSPLNNSIFVFKTKCNNEATASWRQCNADTDNAGNDDFTSYAWLIPKLVDYFRIFFNVRLCWNSLLKSIQYWNTIARIEVLLHSGFRCKIYSLLCEIFRAKLIKEFEKCHNQMGLCALSECIEARRAWVHSWEIF